MKTKTILFALCALLFAGSFFLIWVDYRVSQDLTGLDFVSKYRYLLLGFAALAVILALLGKYSLISGLFVLLFLAQLFYGASKNQSRLSWGFFVSLALTIVTGVFTMTLKDNSRRNVIGKQRARTLPPHLKEEENPFEM